MLALAGHGLHRGTYVTKAFERPLRLFSRPSDDWVSKRPLVPSSLSVYHCTLQRSQRAARPHPLAATSPVLSESLPAPERRKVEDVILRRQGEVTVGDVAAGAGIGLLEAEQALRALAGDSLATLKARASGGGEMVLQLSLKNFRCIMLHHLSSFQYIFPGLERWGAALSL